MNFNTITLATETITGIDFFDSVITYFKSLIIGIEEIVQLLKTIGESFVYFISWVPQITRFLNTQIITFIPTQLSAVFLVAVAIFVIKLILGGDT